MKTIIKLVGVVMFLSLAVPQNFAEVLSAKIVGDNFHVQDVGLIKTGFLTFGSFFVIAGTILSLGLFAWLFKLKREIKIAISLCGLFGVVVLIVSGNLLDNEIVQAQQSGYSVPLLCPELPDDVYTVNKTSRLLSGEREGAFFTELRLRGKPAVLTCELDNELARGRSYLLKKQGEEFVFVSLPSR